MVKDEGGGGELLEEVVEVYGVAEDPRESKRPVGLCLEVRKWCRNGRFVHLRQRRESDDVSPKQIWLSARQGNSIQVVHYQKISGS